MMKTKPESLPKNDDVSLISETTRFFIQEACRRIPPLWPLKDFVAVNPFIGLTDLHFLEAAAKIRRVAHRDILMPAPYYLQQFDEGRVEQCDLESALVKAEKSIPQPWAAVPRPLTLLSLRLELQTSSNERTTNHVLSFSDFVDWKAGTAKVDFITEEISKWCSVYFDEGQASWRMPWRDRNLYTAWREAALIDATPWLNGWTHFKEEVEQAPSDPWLCIHAALERLGIPAPLMEDFLYRQLITVYGWSCHARFRIREAAGSCSDDLLVELLAIRLIYDLALLRQHENDPATVTAWHQAVHRMEQYDPQLDLLPRYLAQLTLEQAYQRQLLTKILSPSRQKSVREGRKQVQAVFCIDVRSEVFRRALEAQSPAVQTFGFAGFFGMAVEHVRFGERHGSAQCPVLISPSHRVHETLGSTATSTDKARALQRIRLQKRIHHAWNSFKTSAVSCFSFVETAGLLFGPKLAMSSLGIVEPGSGIARTRYELDLDGGAQKNHSHGHGIPLATQSAMAEGALRNLGLTSDFARLILLCGHGSATQNNPYAAGLDCGACGGHTGEVNAKVAAAILNHPQVRQSLAEKGIHIPEDTWFQAGLHVTTTDEVELFDVHLVPDSHRADVDQLQKWLRDAGCLGRQERSSALGLTRVGNRLDEDVSYRSRDWAEVRPEWGLAGNAALVVGPRSMTQGVNLAGRTFLHDYKTDQDPSGSVLELIMTAPMVVTNWINLQYFASTVDNRLFGSGNKTLHNVVGTLGVWQGNGGDLQTGLPLQSLHDGQRWMHEPLRLSVVIEAPEEAVEKVLASHPEIGQLVKKEWLHLIVIDSRTGTARQL